MDNHEMERREYRRKRRIRNQILVYLTMMVVIAAVSLGIIFAVKSNTEKEQAESLTAENLTNIEQIANNKTRGAKQPPKYMILFARIPSVTLLELIKQT